MRYAVLGTPHRVFLSVSVMTKQYLRPTKREHPNNRKVRRPWHSHKAILSPMLGQPPQPQAASGGRAARGLAVAGGGVQSGVG